MIEPGRIEELKQLAKRAYQGEIFITNKQEAIECAFLTILVLAKPEQIPGDVGAIWEEYSKAGPRSINGYPTFMSCHFLTVEESRMFWEYLEKIGDAINAV